ESKIRENNQSFFVPTLVKKNSLINITFEITDIQGYNLKLYDASGRLAKNIHQRVSIPGIHTAEISIKGLNSGVYFIRLESSTNPKIGKLIIY
ncbi:MAG: T9SS type A sorting domain-containing protein, partial [candidate division WOR-3 bacterium]